MFSKITNLDLLYYLISYSVTVIALFTLTASGAIGAISSIIFLFITVLSWKLEGSRWQISEKLGVVTIIFLVPIFYLDWKYNFSGFSSRDTFAAGNLSRLILALISVKLLQKKSERDWVFIYLITFFEILLAAGVGVSPLFFACLLLYLLSSFIAIILFEIRRSSNLVLEKSGKEKIKTRENILSKVQIIKLPITAIFILISISLFAVPLFFAFPRVGGAGFGSNIGGLSGFTGFSDSVRLGEIGKLQQNDAIVMRIRLRNQGNLTNNLRWKGVTLDNFDGQTWSRNRSQIGENLLKTGDYFVFDKSNDVNQLISQTIYLEPIDTKVIFALSRPVALQGDFDYVIKESDGSLATFRRNEGRISYKVFSDQNLPTELELKTDNLPIPSSNNKYLQVPKELDSRIPLLTKNIINESGATNRFEQVKAVEQYLKTNFSYSLDLKAGGYDPLADFLFNIREGHCEYFATSLAIMLRTQGIPTRVVNGFLGGEYNDTADVFVVRQKNAHSWVEVYFPKTKTWIPFDATPAAGQNIEEDVGFFAKLNKTMEALETFWIQYVVGYDNSEQRTLYLSIRKGLSEFQTRASNWWDITVEGINSWWEDVKGEKGLTASLYAIGIGIIYFVGSILGIVALLALRKRIKKLEIWKKIRLRLERRKDKSAVVFYQRLQNALRKKGLTRQSHQTPLEFAFELNMPQAVKITEKYNEVRFGEKNLSKEESSELESWLKELEESK